MYYSVRCLHSFTMMTQPLQATIVATTSSKEHGSKQKIVVLNLVVHDTCTGTTGRPNLFFVMQRFQLGKTMVVKVYWTKPRRQRRAR